MKGLVSAWYKRAPWLIILTPFSLIYRFIVFIRRFYYRVGIFKVHRLAVPVIVVGNITVGGTGKTPFVIWLANYLKTQGYKPGIVSRGYGGVADHYPFDVKAKSDPLEAGDEPVLIARRTQCPVVIDPKRVRAAQYLLAEHDCNIIISDDGLQHYALGRDIEIAIVDGERRYANGFCLPAGPLREPVSRLKSVDFIINNGGHAPGEFNMQLIDKQLQPVSDGENVLAKGSHTHVQAIAGIGNPQRFFNRLEHLGYQFISHTFPDHHQYSFADINFGDDDVILMTEKDAVKCEAFADHRHWYLPVEAELDPAFQTAFMRKLKFRSETRYTTKSTSS